MMNELLTLADKAYFDLSLQEKNTLLKSLLKEMVHSAVLDGQAEDALDVFDEYPWICRDDADPVEFQRLRQKGLEGSMSLPELDQFSNLVSVSGEVHLYCWIRKAMHIVDP